MMTSVLFLPFRNKMSVRLICLILFSVLSIGVNSSPSFNQNQLEDWSIQSSVPTAFFSSNSSEKCAQHSREYLAALRNRLPWAVTMYKSSGRLVENLIYIDGDENDHHESGLFDECLSVQSDGVPFQGQYCTVFFGLINVEDAGNREKIFNVQQETDTIYGNVMPSVGFCLPSTCSASDLNSAVDQLLGFRVIRGRNLSVVALANESHCYTEEKVQSSSVFDNVTLTILSVFCLLAVIVTTATLHDSFTGGVVSRNSFAVQLLHCFSAKKNCQTLFSTEDAKDSLSCVHGIRVVSTCWIVIFHFGGSFVILRTLYNKQTLFKNVFQWEVQFLTNGFFAVDTFFLMSGLLVAFTQLRQLDQNGGIFNLKRFYVRRYIRLTPVYATILAFLAKIGPHVGIGPNWDSIRRISKCIRENWWKHLLYVNNYHPYSISSPDYAFGESWYLACDMQMFLISPLFIYPIWRWKRAGLIWTATCLFVFLGASATVFIVYDLIPTIIIVRPSFRPKIDTYYDKHYTETTARIPPYLIGILLGWLLHKTKDRKIRINNYLVAAGWMTAILLAFVVTYGMFPYLDEATVPVIDPFIGVSFGVMHHSAWAIAISWIIFACTHGYGGFVDRFLSWKLLLPLSRMSYAVFLIHVNLALSYGAQLRKPFYATQLSMTITSFGMLGFAFLFAAVVSVMVEMPFLNLDKLLFSNNSKASEKKNM